MTLGMSIKEIRKLILMENGILAGISIVIGITTGAVFSRLFFLGVVNYTPLIEVGASWSILLL